MELADLQKFCAEYKNEVQSIVQVVKRMPRDLMARHGYATATVQFAKIVVGLRCVFEECKSYVIVSNFAQLLLGRRVEECGCC